MKREAFIYTWTIEDEESEAQSRFHIRMYGLDEEGRNVCLHVDDFMPYFYVEVVGVCEDEIRTSEEGIKKNLMALLGRHDRKECRKGMEGCPYCWRGAMQRVGGLKKLYFHHERNSFGMIRIAFPNNLQRKKAYYRLQEKGIQVGYRAGKCEIRIHENEANPILQFCTQRRIDSCGWIRWTARRAEAVEKRRQTACDREVVRRQEEIHPLEMDRSPPAPLVMSFDIEVYSSVASRMPDPEVASDVIFQISAVLTRDHRVVRNVLLTMGRPSQAAIGRDVRVVRVADERALLLAFVGLVREENPNLMIGYNILGFDLMYMIARAKRLGIMEQFDQMGMRLQDRIGLPCHAPEVKIEWSSSAYSCQSFFFLDTEGRLFVDLLPIIRRDYKFENYRLKTVSEFFVGDTKDPITPKNIFDSYRQATEQNNHKLLGRVGKYCVQDSALVLRLFEKLQLWIGLCEMAKTCRVPILTLYTQGQQIKVFSQLYFQCTHDRIVVQSPHSLGAHKKHIEGAEHYSGAMVFTPDPGVYDNVIPFDFTSLYPTTIIAYNIDFSTLVIDDHIPDDRCHVIEWWDHIGCEHDRAVHAVKIKNPVCQKFRYRFLREPMGVIPRLLQQLLRQRKTTKGQMKEVAERMETDTSQKLLYQVYDKRQLAYKVSANSMYGAMGVKKGYLPFLPGAMCTTAMGRCSIQKAADYVSERFQGKIVYGDSVAGYTPIPIRVDGGEEMMVAIEMIAERFGGGEWVKMESSGKEACELRRCCVEVWTELGWTRVERVIRHGLDVSKRMIRVITGSGVVDVTDDHSLLYPDGSAVSPRDLAIDDLLLHSSPIRGGVGMWRDELLTELVMRSGDWERLARDVRMASGRGWRVGEIWSEDGGRIGVRMVREEEEEGGRRERMAVRSMEVLEDFEGMVYDLTTANHHFGAGIGSMIMHNTDSIYCHFPLEAGVDYARRLWDHAKRIEKDLVKIFPDPMRLVFEEKIYKKFLILTKKRYMALTCDHTGVEEDKLTIRGVLLARRDNARWVRQLYEHTVRAIMANATLEEIYERTNEELLRLFRGTRDVPLRQFIISKTLGKDYAIRPIPTDEKKKKKRLEDLGIRASEGKEDEVWRAEYESRSRPAHVQLSEKMKSRGCVVEPGSRIEFVVTRHPDGHAKLFERIEDPGYMREHSDMVRIDPLYYAQNLVNPMDQILEVCFHKKNVVRQLTETHALFRMLMDELLWRMHPYQFDQELHPDAARYERAWRRREALQMKKKKRASGSAPSRRRSEKQKIQDRLIVSMAKDLLQT